MHWCHPASAGMRYSKAVLGDLVPPPRIPPRWRSGPTLEYDNIRGFSSAIFQLKLRTVPAKPTAEIDLSQYEKHTTVDAFLTTPGEPAGVIGCTNGDCVNSSVTCHGGGEREARGGLPYDAPATYREEDEREFAKSPPRIPKTMVS
ncbi:hypothetical protein GCM10010116_20520 [Microbispora rosea subsp. aerata]|nr:hypothetical protein GCM10010116_20520 [Microbispora rosea subsp. aerata]GIH53334.1 hypothetical protein Mro02_02480 [Microbispora rosea subsp. aerata]GLJ83014.1 hypothetical protein GCM10017588_17400 [Microbispora rosea subsp. aerata]